MKRCHRRASRHSESNLRERAAIVNKKNENSKLVRNIFLGLFFFSLGGFSIFYPDGVIGLLNVLVLIVVSFIPWKK
jgi:hypothetical protein